VNETTAWPSLRIGVVVGALMLLLACGRRHTNQPIFLNGRAIVALEDSTFVATSEGAGLMVFDPTLEHADTIGSAVLASPFHAQEMNGILYVSDIVDSRPAIVTFAKSTEGRWEMTGRIGLGGITPLSHQFAVLPDGRIIVESPDDRLVSVHGDTVATFALTELGPRPSLVMGARGGVFHAVPDKHITLYNEFGHIRWQHEWPWLETALFSDVAVDARGRIHMLAGVPSEGTFIVYTLVGDTGEVERWSTPGPAASFEVTPFGEVLPLTNHEF
jgi:hypothetical protein